MTPNKMPSNKRNQTGLTMVELMIAMVLGLLLLTGIIQLFTNNNQTYRITENMSRLQENGRFSIQFLTHQVSLAGFKGNVEGSARSIFPTAARTVDGTAYNFQENQTIVGIEGAAGAPDTLVVRYFGGNDVTMADCLGSTIATDEEIILKYSIDAANSELECSTLNIGSGLAGVQPIIDDVVDMQILYGMTTDLTNDHDFQVNCFLTAVNVTTNNVSDCINGLNFNQVVSIKINLLLRSNEDNLTADGQAMSYSFNGTILTATDNRIYREFSKTIAIRNKIL